MKNRGFTLIEILVVVSILGVLGIIFTDILAQVLRGQNKVKVISQVKQNGQVVLDRLTSEIRQAENIICVEDNSSDSDTLKDTIVIFKGGFYKKYRLHLPTATENGKITRNDFSKENIPDGVNYDELCRSNEVYGNANSVTNMTNTDPVNGVSLEPAENHVFQEQKKEGFGSIITITFKAMAGVGAGSAYEASVAEGGVLFTTTAQVKGLKQ